MSLTMPPLTGEANKQFAEAVLRYVSDADGNAVGVIVPIDLWQEHRLVYQVMKTKPAFLFVVTTTSSEPFAPHTKLDLLGRQLYLLAQGLHFQRGRAVLRATTR